MSISEKLRVPVLKAGTPLSKPYIESLRIAINSDGCTDVPDLYGSCCVLHDLCYHCGINEYGEKVKKKDADRLLRKCMQCESPLGRFSLVSWTYWIGVRFLGWKAYAEDIDARPEFETYIWS